MEPHPLVECSFLIPKRRDKILSDGKPHGRHAWEWLRGRLMERFEGFTVARQGYFGSYLDPDTREAVPDESRKYFVAMPPEHVDELRRVLGEACDVFKQKCIYLSVAGHVEFVVPETA